MDDIDRTSYLKGGFPAINDINIISTYLFISACNWFTYKKKKLLISLSHYPPRMNCPTRGFIYRRGQHLLLVHYIKNKQKNHKCIVYNDVNFYYNFWFRYLHWPLHYNIMCSVGAILYGVRTTYYIQSRAVLSARLFTFFFPIDGYCA